MAIDLTWTEHPECYACEHPAPCVYRFVDNCGAGRSARTCERCAVAFAAVEVEAERHPACRYNRTEVIGRSWHRRFAVGIGSKAEV